MSDLLPCPFCGASAQVIEAEASAYCVECTGCHASTRLHFACGGEPVRDVTEAWNKRIPGQQSGVSVAAGAVDDRCPATRSESPRDAQGAHPETPQCATRAAGLPIERVVTVPAVVAPREPSSRPADHSAEGAAFQQNEGQS